MFRLSFRPSYWGAGFIAALAAPALALAATPVGQEGVATGHPYIHGAYGVWHGPLTVILTVIAVALITMLVVRICGSRCRRHHPHAYSEAPNGSEKSALDMLRVRFACGEIDAEEYKARKKVLEE